ncbi:hypothetical protein [Amycolatopsis sp. NBC_00438]|uniref:hypothetical protein n=1 Tax=Amycolatopsis sp. NBC_00438 TaxID=2903558 RepID=UPI002E1F2560
MAHRPALAELGLSTGKKTRLHRILHEHGLRNGTAFFLPYDHGPEHGPRDFFANPAAGEIPPDAEAFSSLHGSVEDAVRLGMPLIVWAYSRGSAIEGRGGKAGRARAWGTALGAAVRRTVS